MFCVVKCETPPVLRWKLCEFQDRKSISISGINLIVWRGLVWWLCWVFATQERKPKNIVNCLYPAGRLKGLISWGGGESGRGVDLEGTQIWEVVEPVRPGNLERGKIWNRLKSGARLILEGG